MENDLTDDMQEDEYKLPPGFYIPFGAKLSDIFISAKRVMLDMEISKSTLLRWKKKYNLDCSESPTGSFYYFKQQIAKMMFERKAVEIKKLASKTIKMIKKKNDGSK